MCQEWPYLQTALERNPIMLAVLDQDNVLRYLHWRLTDDWRRGSVEDSCWQATFSSARFEGSFQKFNSMLAMMQPFSACSFKEIFVRAWLASGCVAPCVGQLHLLRLDLQHFSHTLYVGCVTNQKLRLLNIFDTSATRKYEVKAVIKEPKVAQPRLQKG